MLDLYICLMMAYLLHIAHSLLLHALLTPPPPLAPSPALFVDDG